MTKREFLEKLRVALAGRVSAAEVTENINYYEDYINTQVRMGRSEEEVVASLGDPRLLVKSIAEAEKHAGNAENVGTYTYSGSGGSYYGQRQNYSGQGQNNYGSGWNGAGSGWNGAGTERKTRIPVWLIIFIAVFVFVLVLGVAFSFLALLAPILIPVALVVILVRVLTKNT